ncbi:MAG: hypothetical protein P8L20_11985 [Flavobacteriales bacterium]|nr:hypothetical protein [Flavobacteriales bacterium]
MCIKTILVGLFFLTTFNFAAQTVEQQNFINDLDIFVEKKKKDFSSFELNFLETIEDIELTQDHLTWRAEHLKNYLEKSKDNLTDEEITDFEIKFENYRELLKLCKEKTRSVYLNKKRR